MRTTINLDQGLLTEAKVLAQRTGKTLTAVIEEALRERLATRVQIRAGKKGTGVIEVPYHGSEDFERIFVLLAGREATEIVG